MSNLGRLLDLFGSRVKGFDVKNPDSRKIATNYVNLAWKEVYRAHDWEHRKKKGFIVLTPNYTTGTCTVTQYNGTNETAARTVVFSGATLIAAMQGRFFKVNGSGDWHRIASVDVAASTVYLETPVLDAGGSGKEYEIWKRYYYAYSEADAITGFAGMNAKLSFTPSNHLPNNTATTGTPERFSAYGMDPYEGTYSTGTISIAKDSNVVVGVDTAWLSKVHPGDKLTVDTKVFHVKRAESDTRIVLYNYADSEVAAGSSYVIEQDNPLGFEFYYSANEFAILPYDYMARGFDLVHETKDFTLLPDDFDEAIVTRACGFHYQGSDDAKWAASIQLYQAELDGLKLKRNVVQPPYRQFAPGIPSGMPGR